jgi:cytochrome bd-type quinol oxidase subunit 1
VKGLNDLQAEFEAKYGPGDYMPSIPIAYWSFRIMVAAGTLMVLLAVYAVLVAYTGNNLESDNDEAFSILHRIAIHLQHIWLVIDRDWSAAVGSL